MAAEWVYHRNAVGRDDNAAISCFALLGDIGFFPEQREKMGKGLSRPARTEEFCSKHFLAEAALAADATSVHPFFDGAVCRSKGPS